MHCFPLLAVFVGGEIVDMISNSGAVAKLVLLALLAFSLISWSIILTKWSRLRRARAQSGRFVRAFRKAQRLQDIAQHHGRKKGQKRLSKGWAIRHWLFPGDRRGGSMPLGLIGAAGGP